MKNFRKYKNKEVEAITAAASLILFHRNLPHGALNEDHIRSMIHVVGRHVKLVPHSQQEILVFFYQDLVEIMRVYGYRDTLKLPPKDNHLDFKRLDLKSYRIMNRLTFEMAKKKFKSIKELFDPMHIYSKQIEVESEENS